jgi:transposase
LLASILLTDRDSHRLWRPNEPLTQEMLAQVRLIETLRRSIQRQRSQLRAVLLRTFPQALDLFGKLTAQITLRFLFDFPTAQQAQALSLQAFTNWCKDQRYSRPDLISRRFVHLQEPALQANPTITQAYRVQVRILASVLLPQVRHRQQTLACLGRLFSRHPDAFIFDSLPGTGELLAPALLTKFGDHRERFRTSAEVQALAGTCPVTEWSGKRRRVKFRRGCDKEFRRIAQQFALSSVAQSGWAAAYWAEARSRCDSDSHAYRCLANRWLTIIWKMWQDRKPYDEAFHIQQRASRRRPRSRR